MELRDPIQEIVTRWTTKSGELREKSTTIWKPIPVVEQMRVLLQGAVGKQMRRSKEYGICCPLFRVFLVDEREDMFWLHCTKPSSYACRKDQFMPNAYGFTLSVCPEADSGCDLYGIGKNL